tara:strand:- start:39 stop:611 length:573 start_codon:yes stop_codon:yes gene_type:complete
MSLKEILMPDFKILNLYPLDEQKLYDGVYLIILNARNVPPHLSLTVSGKVYGISIKGPTFDKDVNVYLNYIRKHNIESIFVQLKLPIVYTDIEMLSAVRKVIKAYPRVDIGLATCLSPIKDFMSSAYKTDIHDVHLIFDLLPKLKEQDVIEGYYQMNLNEAVKNGQLLMKRYSFFDVNEAIHKSLSKQII